MNRIISLRTISSKSVRYVLFGLVFCLVWTLLSSVHPEFMRADCLAQERSKKPRTPGTSAPLDADIVKLTPSDASEMKYGNGFGCSVSISGKTVIIGARYDTDKGKWAGAAYIFHRSGGGANGWQEVKKLIPSDAHAKAYSGTSVSISGKCAIVGSPRNDNKNGPDSGAAYIFSKNHGGKDNWGEVKKLISTNKHRKDRYYGDSVSISGKYAVVGNTHGGIIKREAHGAVHIYKRNQGGKDNWGLVKTLIGPVFGDHFGYSVAISGNLIIVGGPWAGG